MGTEAVAFVVIGSLVGLVLWTALAYSAGKGAEEARTQLAQERLDRALADYAELEKKAEQAANAAAGLVEDERRIGDVGVGDDWVQVYPESRGEADPAGGSAARPDHPASERLPDVEA